MRRTLVLWFGLIAWYAAASDAAEDAAVAPAWSQFRGPNASGIAADDQRVPVAFGLDRNLAWKTPLLPGASSPCLWDDRIYLTAFDADANRLEVISLDRNDGKVIWRTEVTTQTVEKVHSASTPATATIATDGQRIFVYFGSRGLLCYDLQGKLVWSIDMPIPATRNGSGTSPIVAGDLVLLNRDQGNAPQLIAVDRETGELVWKHDYQFGPGILTEGYATPIVWNDQVILHTHEGMRAFTLSDGTPVWQVNASTTGCSTPVIAGNRLYVATWQNLGEPALRQDLPTYQQLLEHDADGSGTISFQEIPAKYLLFDRPEAADEQGVRLGIRGVARMADQDGDGELSDPEWQQFVGRFSSFITDHGLLAIQLGGQGDVTQSHVKVMQTRSIPEVPSPLVHQDRIYLVKNGGIVTCLDANSGERHYQKRLSASGSYYASPIAVGQQIYLASAQGVVTVLRAGDRLDVLAENDLGERIMATPAVSDGTLYVRTHQHLYAFTSDP